MKKILSILLVLALAASLCACGESKQETPAPAAAEAPAKSADLPAKPTESAKADTPAPAATEAPAPEKQKADSPAGYYKMTEVTSDGKTEDVSAMAELGLIYYLVLEENGTGYLEIMGEKDSLSWDDKSIQSEDAAPVPYTYADGTLKMEDPEGVMTFVRLTEEEIAFYRENGSGSIENLFGGLFTEGERYENSGSIEDCYVEFVGAEALEDEDGKPALRVWFEFTNGSDEITSFYDKLSVSATQDGEDLEWTYLFEDVPETGYSSLGVAPGCTIRCAELFGFDPDGGEIEASISAFLSDTVYVTLDPNDLPGAPEDEFVLAVDADALDYGLDDVEDYNEEVEIGDAEIVSDYDGEDAVLIHIRWTNRGEETESFFLNYDVYVLQDGFGLTETGSDDYAEEQNNIYEDVKPGESIDIAVVYLLRNYNDIAVALKELFDGDSYIGCVYGEN